MSSNDPTTAPMLSVPFDSSFRSDSGEPEDLSPPSGFAFTADGLLVLSDDFNHRIQIYDTNGKLTQSFGGKGKKNGQFHYPKGIAVDGEGNIYVADSWNHRVQKLDSQGNHLLAFGTCGEGRGELNEPYDILVEDSGNILVVERYNHRIQWFTPDGESLGWLGGRGTVLEEHLAVLYETPAKLFSAPAFEFPTSIARDSAGNTFITDSGNHRVAKFDADWKRVLTFGERGEEPGQFQYPLCVAVDKNDLVYVADLNNNRVQVFTSFGQLMGVLDQADDSTPLKAPSLTAIDPQGKLHVGLTFNPSVFRFSPPSDSLETVAEARVQSDPNNPSWSLLQGQLAEQTGDAAKAAQAYAQAIQLLWLGEDDKQHFDTEPLLNLSRLALKETNSSEWEAPLLKGLEVFARSLQQAREELTKTYEAWQQAGKALDVKNFQKQLEVLDDREDPRVFNQELFDADKKHIILFRKMRAVSYNLCLLSDRMAEYLGNVLATPLSDSAIRAICDHLTGRLNELGELFSARLGSKEKNEAAMVQAFNEMQEDQTKWEIFLSNFHSNNRTMNLLASLLFELRTILLALKSAAQALPENQTLGESLSALIAESPGNQIVPKILLGIQENRGAHSLIDILWRDLTDTWLAHWGTSMKPATRTLDPDYFSPVAYDVEDLNIEEIARSYRSDGTGFEKTASGLVAGGEVYSTDSLADALPQKLVEVLDAQDGYEEKNEELFQQLKDLSRQRRDLDTQLKNVAPNDKRTPLSIGNNVAIVDFQITLLKRMILTLEVNEAHNLNKLILGAALVAAHEKTGNSPPAKTLFEKLTTYRTQEEQRVTSLAQKRKSIIFQVVDLTGQQESLNLGQNIEAIDRSVQLAEEIAEVQIEQENLEFNLLRHARICNRLNRLFGFFKETGAYEKAAPASILVPAFGHAITRTGPAMGTPTQPMGLAFDPEGNLFLVDQENH
ncbi:MAG: hypothetical protein IID18_02290, partial [Nitrospinae bacterium]|nr:hypothetical protein [Nitrospinota bacterium]